MNLLFLGLSIFSAVFAPLRLICSADGVAAVSHCILCGLCVRPARYLAVYPARPSRCFHAACHLRNTPTKTSSTLRLNTPTNE